MFMKWNHELKKIGMKSKLIYIIELNFLIVMIIIGETHRQKIISEYPSEKFL